MPWQPHALRLTWPVDWRLQATVYVYQLVAGEVKVEKIDFRKAGAAAPPPAPA
jgi:hypothetical protein